ncbi:uncharacterized protein BJ171DRAFT_617784 [Polychytrium aggregatum]|uniref:uncharacterized protein n=1 Tax=Polychytrium aggregatum TaxID=110093 RepID=UPI0022FDF062|nr:uncharacterized protein BJ171DRAFT_617784 [Polychytrium aggregatum]KAI9204828.1 hypothetical protein BJ171DRAFT_617784 [Polychytrium aggregatum]
MPPENTTDSKRGSASRFPKVPAGQNVTAPAEGGSENEVASAAEIPIAARSKGPGPAAYTLPSTIGLNAKTGVRAPAYSFGIKLYGKLASETPGPNAFFPQTTRTGTSKGPAFSLQGGYKKERRDVDLDTPGPGKYNPTYIPTKEAKAPAYSMGGRRNNEKANINPGPAEYSIASTLGLRPAITMPAAAAYTIKPPRPMKLESFSPGPAAYSALDPSKIKKSAPAYSLDAYEYHTANGHGQSPMPGPGHYTPNFIQSKEAAPMFSFRCKHSEYELFVPDTTEGEFIF